jgi:Inner membrane protein YgaP-like, transmembrane domain
MTTHYAGALAMTVNENLQDRIIRTLVGLTVTAGAVIMATAVPVLSPTGIVNLLFLVLGVEVLVTGLIGWSPVYSLFGFSTTGRVGG